MLSQCKTLLRYLAQFFIKADCLNTENIHQINIDYEDNLLPLHKIYIGEYAIQTIEEIRKQNSETNSDKIQIFYTNVQNFYKISFKELVHRIPYNEPFLNSLDFLKPENALEIAHSPQPIFNIINRFPSKFNKEQVAKEAFIAY